MHAEPTSLFRPSRPDFIETYLWYVSLKSELWGLFRPSRPDFIETYLPLTPEARGGALFRPSRPDFIET